MEYARTAIQSAHHHYRQAMNLVDAVCSPKKNRWEAILGDEQSRQETYRGESAVDQDLQLPYLISSCLPGSSLYHSVLSFLISGFHLLTSNRYTEAAEWAQKAQICFNECAQSLTPHWGLLKRDELQDCEDLKETGLLQAVQLYKLMYGGKVLQMGITRAYPPSLRPFHPSTPTATHFHCGRVPCGCSAVALAG